MTTNKIASKFTLFNYIKNRYLFFQKTVHNMCIKNRINFAPQNILCTSFFHQQNTKRHSNIIHKNLKNKNSF
jgi:hypothetical protein